MKKDVVAEKDVSREEKIPMQKPVHEYVRGPGLGERTLMFLLNIFKYLVRFMEKKIQILSNKRLAKKMDGDKEKLI